MKNELEQVEELKLKAIEAYGQKAKDETVGFFFFGGLAVGLSTLAHFCTRFGMRGTLLAIACVVFLIVFTVLFSIFFSSRNTMASGHIFDKEIKDAKFFLVVVGDTDEGKPRIERWNVTREQFRKSKVAQVVRRNLSTNEVMLETEMIEKTFRVRLAFTVGETVFVWEDDDGNRVALKPGEGRTEVSNGGFVNEKFWQSMIVHHKNSFSDSEKVFWRGCREYIDVELSLHKKGAMVTITGEQNDKNNK